MSGNIPRSLSILVATPISTDRPIYTYKLHLFLVHWFLKVLDIGPSTKPCKKITIHKTSRLVNSNKLARKRNATNIFPKHFVSRANITYIYGTQYTLYASIISSYLNSAAQNSRAARAVAPRGEWIQNLLCKLPHSFTVYNVYSTRI